MDSESDQPQAEPVNWWPRMAFIVGAILILGAVVFWLVRSYSDSSYKGSVTRIRLGSPSLGPDLSELIWVADSKKMFARHGLDVDISLPPSTLEIQQKLNSGELDLGLATEFSYTAAVLAADPLKAKVIAALDKSRTIDFVARKSSGISQPADLRGKKIAVYKRTSIEYFFGAFLTYNNVPLDDVQVVDLPSDKSQQAVVLGEVDAAIINDPYAYRAKQALGDNAVSWSAQSNVDFSWVLMGADKFVADNPQALQRFLQALLEAEQFVREYPAESKEILAKKFDLSPDYVDLSWSKHSYRISLDQSLLLTMEDASRWRINNKLTEVTTVPNYLDFMYLDALEAVAPDRITIIR